MLRKIWEFIKILAFSLAIILPIRYFIIQPFYVKGASMEPTFHDHEYLIINEIGYRLGEPQRGDVVVFRYPKDPREFFIKRIIGLPGETVEVKEGGISIYQTASSSPTTIDESSYLSDEVKTFSWKELGYDFYGYQNTEDGKVVLGDRQYYVLGDNRAASKDSRFFGPVDESFFVGKVWLRGWPINKAGVFKEINYPNINN